MSRKTRLLIMLLFMLSGAIFLSISPLSALFFKGLGVTMGALTVLWLISLAIKDSSIIDIYWGIGFVIMVWFYFNLTGNDFSNIRSTVFATMVSIWGLRLGIYLASRNLGKGEDFRYQEFRRQGGKHYWWISYLRVFVLQGWILWVVSSIFVLSLNQGVTELGILDFVGIGFWIVGLLFESVGDYQLTQFKKKPANKGKVMDKGLWKYTRHPNYFGDALLWWGYFMFALSNPDGIFYIFSPLFMTYLLMKVSGVAMLESTLKQTKPKYADYIRRTSTFFPMPPKK